ncbi:MAG TPA: protein kinase [Vicinamibacterales bacterium]|jgi:serine/threonine-protein kinase|nr:protein kinase [Vicinamibacterales bacterium]
MSPAPGTRIGPYEVLGPLASGGMGDVYRARDTRLARDAALKLLPADVQLDAGRVARFEREARTLATLSHANIATLFGVEEWNGIQALAMEFVEGQTLADHLARPDRAGALPLAEALAIARQIAVALDAAHEHGIVHRDLKPGNVMIRPDDTVKVLDFGLAMGAPDDQGDAGTSSTLTGAGTVVGTPAYMSPEQARGQRVDRRTDIWSFGCVLFELLSGRRAFEGPTSSDVLVAVLEHDPEWSRLPASTPAPLRRLLSRCLTKDPRRRLRDMGDVVLELDEVSNGGDSRGTMAAISPGIRRWWPLAAAIVAMAAGAAGWLVWGRTPAPAIEPQRFAIVFPPDAPMSVVGGIDLGHLAISPDGSRIVYPTPRGLAVKSRDRLEMTFIDLPGENANSPFFSPDGRWIAYTTSSTSLRKVAVSGGASAQVASTGNAAVGAWGDTVIVFADQRGLFRVPAEGGRVEAVPLELGPNEQATLPDVLPGGRVALVTIITTKSNTPLRAAMDASSRIDAVDLDSGARKTVVTGGGQPRYLASGHLAFGSGNTMRAVAFDPQTLQVRGTPVEVMTDAGSAFFGASREGTIVFLRGSEEANLATLVWVDRSGREEPLGAPVREYHYPRISPDGRRIGLDIGGVNRDLYIWDIARRVMERLTTDPAEDAMVRWSPDGTRIAYANSRYGIPNVFWQRADGTGAAERIFESAVLSQPGPFTRDGGMVLSELVPGRGRGLLVASIRPPHTRRRLLDNAVNAELSPDGRWLAYGSTQSGQFEVYVTSFPDTQGRWQISTGGGRQAAWSRDGHELFYRDFAGALIAVPVTLSPTFEAGASRRLFSDPAYRGSGSSLSDRTYDISPDGRRFVMIRNVDQPPRSLAVVQNWFDELRRRVPVN